MISFNLATINRETLFIQRRAKTRNNFPRKTFQNFTLNSIIFSSFNQINCFITNLLSSSTALRHFKREAMAEMNFQFTIEEDQEMETQPIYLSSDEREIASPCSSPAPQLPNSVPDTYSAITQLRAAQHEKMSSSGIFALQYPTTPPTSLISDDDNDEVLTPKIGNPGQFLPYTPNCHPIPPIMPTNNTHPRYAGISDPTKFWAIRHLASLRYSQPTFINFIKQPNNITTVADGLRNLTLHPHLQCNEWVTG